MPWVWAAQLSADAAYWGWRLRTQELRWVHDDPISNLEATTVEVGGTRYRVYALHRSAAFPQRTGHLTIGAPRVTFDVGGLSLFDASERIQRTGVPVSVKVQPLPKPVPPNAVVGRYEARASLDRTSVTTGDAVTFQVDATGVGNIQDLRVELPPIVGVRTLQPAIRDRQELRDGRLSGTRTWEWILIAEAPGEHRIPAIEIHYFDPESESYGIATTEELTFAAAGNPRGAQPALEPVAPPSQVVVPTFGPLRMASALRRNEVPVRSRGWFGWLLALPPFALLAFAVATGVARRRQRRSTDVGAVQRKLVRSAKGALDRNEPRAFYDGVVAAITHALDVRLGEPVGGLPHTELRGRLTRAGFDDDLSDRVINELEGADFARFAASGVDKDEMERCLQRTTTIIERVQRAKGSA